MLDQSEIANHLATFIDRAEAERRAALIVTDLADIGFDLQVCHDTTTSQWLSLGVKPQCEYLIPKSGHELSPPPPCANEDGTQPEPPEPPIASDTGGSFLSAGNLLRLSQSISAGHEFALNLWPSAFADRIRKGDEHLNALNELWWLRLWRGLEHVERGPKLGKAKPDYEWVLTIRDGITTCRVNLEVKRREGDIKRLFNKDKRTYIFSEVAKKFAEVPNDQANVVAITLYVPMKNETRSFIWDWLNGKPHIDGVLIWTEGNFKCEPMFKAFKPAKKWAELLIKSHLEEDVAPSPSWIGQVISAPN